MKRFFFLLAMHVCLVNLCSAQVSANGIYMNAADYSRQKLTYSSNNTTDIQADALFSDSQVSTRESDRNWVKLSKNSIFGYRKNGHDFRFVGTTSYEIIDTAGFLVYSRVVMVPGYKHLQPQKQYFFSVNPDTQLMRLTRANINIAFGVMADFRYAVTSHFHNDAELMNTDPVENRLELKHLYFEYKQNNNIVHANK